MGSPMGYDLRDIRIHDSRQASNLAGKRGGGAAGGAGYTRGSPRIPAGSKVGAGLPGHERMQVNRRTSDRSLLMTMPLRRSQSLPAGRTADSVQSRQKEATIQRAGEADMPQTESPSGSSSAAKTGPEAMANTVYRMMMRDLELESERRP